MISNFEKSGGRMPCKKEHSPVHPKKNGGFFIVILLALLPKCPFCFMALTSTMMLCGEGGILISNRTFSSSSTLIFTTLLCLVAFICIILNYRDNRTKYAIALALSGITLIITGVAVAGGLPVYYGGVLLVFIGVWLNGSLLHFVKKIKHNVGIRGGAGFKTISAELNKG